jgi:hypothetical protein
LGGIREQNEIIEKKERKIEYLKGGAGAVITVHCWYAPTPVVLPGSSPPQGSKRRKERN